MNNKTLCLRTVIQAYLACYIQIRNGISQNNAKSKLSEARIPVYMYSSCYKCYKMHTRTCLCTVYNV